MGESPHEPSARAASLSCASLFDPKGVRHMSLDRGIRYLCLLVLLLTSLTAIAAQRQPALAPTSLRSSTITTPMDSPICCCAATTTAGPGRPPIRLSVLAVRPYPVPL